MRFPELPSLVRSLANAVQETAFDLRYGVNTRGDVTLDALRIDSPNAVHGIKYSPTHPRSARRVFDDLPIDDFSRYVFIDFGSGKGRMLLRASERPFQKVIGVEFAPELHRIAVENIRRYRNPRQQCRDVVSLNQDAAEYEFPISDAVLYLFFPFQKAVMAPLLQRLDQSLRDHPRAVFLIYMNPELASLLDEMRCMELFRVTRYYRVYRSRRG